jgi:hypothetical protein
MYDFRGHFRPSSVRDIPIRDAYYFEGTEMGALTLIIVGVGQEAGMPVIPGDRVIRNASDSWR